MRTFVILKSGGGELANQLWNYISIYATALHLGAHVHNPAFFEYHRYFSLWRTEGWMTRFYSFWFQGTVRRRSHPINRFWRRIYAVHARLLATLHRTSLLSSENQSSTVTYLPPTADTTLPGTGDVYFTGWLFRNPEGLSRYREEIRTAFAPVPWIANRVAALSKELRTPDSTLIGIHLRQGDYTIFKNGAYLITPARMREVLDEYVAHNSLSPETVQVFIASDGPVPSGAFSGYSVHISKEQAVTDLFMLSHCDVIIGSNSSFGHFASWYGNIPHIVATKESMDWEYYADKGEYFPNTYATLAIR